MRIIKNNTPIKTIIIDEYFSTSIDPSVAFDLDREFVHLNDKNSNEGPSPFYKAIWLDLLNDDSEESTADEFSKIVVHSGLELTYAQLLIARLGYMKDKAGSREEVTFGLGLKTSAVLADFGMIFTLGENDIRNNQVRFSLTYAR